MSCTTSYAYDLHGNIAGKTLPNGETIAQTHDALNRVTVIEGQRPSGGGLLYRYALRYDLAGNVVFLHEDYQDTAPARWREVTQQYDDVMHEMIHPTIRQVCRMVKMHRAA